MTICRMYTKKAKGKQWELPNRPWKMGEAEEPQPFVSQDDRAHLLPFPIVAPKEVGGAGQVTFCPMT